MQQIGGSGAHLDAGPAPFEPPAGSIWALLCVLLLTDGGYSVANLLGDVQGDPALAGEPLKCDFDVFPAAVECFMFRFVRLEYASADRRC